MVTNRRLRAAMPNALRRCNGPLMNADVPKRIVNTTDHVLIIDGQRKNRLLLRETLESLGYRVSEASDEEWVFQAIIETPPDVIFLDATMPGEGGFELCKRLKANSNTAAIPILMVAPTGGRDNRLKSIEMGANDLITLPIDVRDVFLRVRNAMDTKSLFDRLEEKNQQLQRLEVLRDNLIQMVIHDLRNPLSGIMGYLEIIGGQVAGKMDGEVVDSLKRTMALTNSLKRMIDQLLDINRLEAGAMPLSLEPCDLVAVTKEAIETLGSPTDRVNIRFAPPPKSVRIVCDPDVISRVISNILGNAVAFSPKGGEIRIRIEENGAETRVLLSDQGPGIPSEYHEKIFEKFGQVEIHKAQRRHSAGMGLTFCKLAVEAHGGRIGLESEAGKGSTFWFVLPATRGRREATSETGRASPDSARI